MTKPWDPATDGPLQPVPGGVVVHVLAFPKAGRSEIAGVRNGRLLVRVTAPPEDGKANAAIVKLLAGSLQLSQSSIELHAGATSREKQFVVSDSDLESLRLALNL